MYGPKENFKYYGYSVFSSSAGFNSLQVINKGKRFVEFKDKSIIEFNFCEENFSNCFWGTVNLQSLGTIIYVDKKNDLQCTLKFKNDAKK